VPNEFLVLPLSASVLSFWQMGESSEDIESESEEEDVGHVDPEASESSIRNSILQRHLRRHAPAWLREAGPTSQVVTIAEAEQQLAQAETARQQGNTLFREKQVPSRHLMCTILQKYSPQLASGKSDRVKVIVLFHP
jgi:hypothetical protein